ncbi:hypothetical protein SAMN04488054_10293 [Salibacterium qingdaonense]|uniref:Uncharacterized protein n=1 Tax=Salibacterium qingdaonense TaxID=266892 RepID=A0A1I4IK37_9BACI|nr:hypothetical protein SAMN04488054_10293 [Salibacterium qingdaonense]
MALENAWIFRHKKQLQFFLKLLFILGSDHVHVFFISTWGMPAS